MTKFILRMEECGSVPTVAVKNLTDWLTLLKIRPMEGTASTRHRGGQPLSGEARAVPADLGDVT